MTRAEFINNIPSNIQQSNNCVCWIYEERDGKPTKIPINAKTGGKAQSNNPGTWTDFNTAVDAWIKHKYKGIGFMFSDGYVGVDIDHCINELGELSEQAKDILSTLNSYSEISPSDTGIHIYVKGKLPPSGRRNGSVEMYEKGRFFTITGKVLEGYSRDIEDRTNELNIVHKNYIQKEEKPQESKSFKPIDLDTSEIIQKACNAANGNKFNDLYRGNWKGSYASQSEADQGFCNMLAFWCGCDTHKMDSIFRYSDLYRKKWDARHGVSTYGELTIQKAVRNCREVYEPQRQQPKINGEETSQANIYKFSDAGNAERFANVLKGRYLYIPESKQWYFYNGKIWEEDSKNNIVNDVIQCLRYAQKLATEIVDEDKRTKTLKWLLNSESQSKINAAISLMSSISFMCASISIFDRNEMFLNTQNWTIDLKTGQKRPHSKDDYITRICNVDYDENADCPLFKEKFAELTDGSKEKQKYLQRLIGYFATSRIDEQEFYQWTGGGANGKTLIAETIKNILGTYCISLLPDILMQKDFSNIPNDIARLKGARCVFMSEPDPGKKFSDNAIKSLTGGDTVTARFLHKEWFEFVNHAKLCLLTNHVIKAIGTDNGLWRRIVVIPFTYTVPEYKRDKRLSEKLMKEAPGILNWIIEGCLMWQSEGLKQPEDLKQAKDDYRKSQDAVGLFLDECCIVDLNSKIPKSDIYNEYIKWCKDNGEYEISQRQLSIRIQEKGFEEHKGTAGVRFWKGIRLDSGFSGFSGLNSNKLSNKNIYIKNSEKTPPNATSAAAEFKVDKDFWDKLDKEAEVD